MLEHREELLYRDTWADINLDAITSNVQAIRQQIPSTVTIMAVVKANAYGHGACPITETALKAGAEYLSVATLGEALELRKSGIVAPILVLGYVSPEYAGVAANNTITLTVVSVKHAEKLKSAMLGDKSLQVHLKIDTGMNRIGMQNARELLDAISLLQRHPSIRITGAFTHFARSDEKDLTFSMEQLEKTQTLFALLNDNVSGELLFHAANSGAILQLPDSYFSMVRLGISLYGVYPSRELKNQSVSLTQALQLKSRVVFVKEVPPGTPIGYGGTFVTETTSQIATIPIGYGDGLPRAFSNRGYLLIHGQRCPIRGRVCMDQTMVDVTALTNVFEGDEVVIYNANTLVELSQLIDTIPYELLCAIAPRVPRRYWRNGKIVENV